jgi:hypothetical protein
MNAAPPRFDSQFHSVNFVCPILFSLVLCFLFSPAHISAATLPEYLGNIQEAKNLIEKFNDLDAADFSNSEYLKIERETLRGFAPRCPLRNESNGRAKVSKRTINGWLNDSTDTKESRAIQRRALRF